MPGLPERSGADMKMGVARGSDIAEWVMAASSGASAAAAWYAVRNPLLKKPCSEKILDWLFPANDGSLMDR